LGDGESRPPAVLFFMGFAELVFSGRTLPYILGVWLLYVAFTSAMDDDSSFDIMDTRVVNLARAMFGDRLSLTKDDNGALFVNKENKTRLSLVGLMVFCLICVDCLLYVDVALTKIEELQGNAFLCFSSAIWASLCMPELIFVTRDMFRRFPGLKYGISAVLVYTGLQMLLSQIWWPPICMDLIIWLSLLVLSTVIPFAGWRPKVLASRSVDAGTQACYMEQDAALFALSTVEESLMFAASVLVANFQPMSDGYGATSAPSTIFWVPPAAATI